MPGARRALDRLRVDGVRIGVVSNQSGSPRGSSAPGTCGASTPAWRSCSAGSTWEFCPHDDGDGCACRKPEPGMIERAAERLGVLPSDCAVIGDIGGDIEAAAAARAASSCRPGGPGRRRSRGRRRRRRRWTPPSIWSSAEGGPDEGPRRTPGQHRRRAARPPPCGRSPRAPTRSCCCAVRAAAPPPTCCRVWTASSSGAPLDRPRPRARRAGRDRPARPGAARVRPGADPHLVPPVAAAARAAAPARRDAVDRRHQRGLSRIAARPAAPARHRRPRAAAHAGAGGGRRVPLPADTRLRVREPLPDTDHLTGLPGYVVVHPGTSVPARAWPPGRCAGRSGCCVRRATGSSSPATGRRRS